MIYLAKDYNNLPTLDTLIANLRKVLGNQPIMHRSPIEPTVRDPNVFIATRLVSGRYSLKPNISCQSALFRGESIFTEESYSCVPSLFRRRPRYLIQNLKYEELQIVMESHPLFKLLRKGISLPFNFNLQINNPYGIAMCYGMDTSLLAFTSDLEVASYYACVKKNDYGIDEPIIPAGDEEKRGILYLFNMIAPFGMTPGLSSVGLQAFERCGLQKSFAINIPRGQDLRNHKFVTGFVFRHDGNISRKIFERFNSGNLLSPSDDLLAKKADDILKSQVISQSAFDRNLAANPRDSRIVNLKEVETHSMSIDGCRCTSFSEEELAPYYESSNQKWESFCKNIIFPGRNGSALKDALLRIPEQTEYRQYFYK